MRHLIWTYLFSAVLLSCSSEQSETPPKFNHDEIEDRKALFGVFTGAFRGLESDYMQMIMDRESKGIKEYFSIFGMDGDTLVRDIHLHLINFGDRIKNEFDFAPQSFVDSLENYLSQLKTIKLPLRQYAYLITIEKHLKENNWTNTVENYEEIELLYHMLYEMFCKSKSNYHYRNHPRGMYDNKSNVLYIPRNGKITDVISTIYMDAPAAIIVEAYDEEGVLLDTMIFESVESFQLPSNENQVLFKIKYPDRLSFVDLISTKRIKDEVLIEVAQFNKIDLRKWLEELIQDRLNSLFPNFLRNMPDTTGLTNFNLRESISVEESKSQLNRFYNGLYGRQQYGFDIDIFSDTLKQSNKPNYLWDSAVGENGLKALHNGRENIGIRGQFWNWLNVITSIEINWTLCMHPSSNYNFGVYRQKGDSIKYFVGDVYFSGFGNGVEGSYQNINLESLEDSLKSIRYLELRKMDGSIHRYEVQNGLSIFNYATNK